MLAKVNAHVHKTIIAELNMHLLYWVPATADTFAAGVEVLVTWTLYPMFLFDICFIKICKRAFDIESFDITELTFNTIMRFMRTQNYLSLISSLSTHHWQSFFRMDLLFVYYLLHFHTIIVHNLKSMIRSSIDKPFIKIVMNW